VKRKTIRRRHHTKRVIENRLRRAKIARLQPYGGAVAACEANRLNKKRDFIWKCKCEWCMWHRWQPKDRRQNKYVELINMSF
jgi:hypothetical protein